MYRRSSERENPEKFKEVRSALKQINGINNVAGVTCQMCIQDYRCLKTGWYVGDVDLVDYKVFYLCSEASGTGFAVEQVLQATSQ